MVLASAIASSRPGDSSTAAATAASTSAAWSRVSARVIAAIFCATHGSTRRSWTSAHSKREPVPQVERLAGLVAQRDHTGLQRDRELGPAQLGGHRGALTAELDQPVPAPAHRHRTRPGLRVLRVQVGPVQEQPAAGPHPAAAASDTSPSATASVAFASRSRGASLPRSMTPIRSVTSDTSPMCQNPPVDRGIASVTGSRDGRQSDLLDQRGRATSSASGASDLLDQRGLLSRTWAGPACAWRRS